jgi:hypothetical protein
VTGAPRTLGAGSGRRCVGPCWYTGPCASKVAFRSDDPSLLAQAGEGCEVDWPCAAQCSGPARRPPPARPLGGGGDGSGGEEEEEG